MKNKTKTTLLIAGIVLVALLLIPIVGCLKCGDGICQRGEERKGSCPEDCITSPSNTPIKSIELFIAKGGRVDWYKGSAHELIAYDAISDDILKNTEVYTVEPDGSGKQCVTCDSDIPKGFVGQPAWHPDGEHIIIQVENSNSKHRVMEHVSFGLNNDLWIIKKNGTGAKRIWTTNLNHAALHPHFSNNGTKLIFAERIPTGVKIPGVGDLTPGGENHWDGWQIRIADFNLENMEITKSTIIKPNGRGFYETNEFYNEEEFTFSFTSNGQPYVDDIYSTKIDGTEVVHIINSPTTWEEHGTFSPAGTGDFVFLSSLFDSTWKAPTSKAATVATELFLKKTNGDIVQLTEMNKNTGSNIRYLVSDYDWDKDGKRIVIQIVPINKKTGRPDSPQIWMFSFKYPFSVKSINFLENIGGRLDLSKDDVIVFDSKGPDGYYDVYVMNMDGTKRKCLTCDKVQVPQKHNGQPAWHPSGDFIVFQSVDPELKGLPKILSEQEKVLTGPGAGVNNNLWLTDKDGERFWQLTEVEDKKGVLHPHFSHDGKKLIWAEIVDQKVKPSGDWVIKIADVIIGENSAKLQNIIVLKPGNMRFFETHGFSADDSKILFSATPDGYYSNLDIYSYDLFTKELKQLTGPDSEWDEHAQYSPDGKKIVWMSSKGISQKIQQYKVKTDYWIMDSNGENKKRITFFNDPQDGNYIEGGVAAADNAWTADGKRILGYLIVREHQADTNILIEFGNKRCICPAVYAPICGSDGIIYNNECRAKCGNGICDVETESNYNCPEDCEKNYNVKSITTIKEYGKSLDWSHTKNLIAFGKHGRDDYYDVYVMEPDGSDEQCLTCDKEGCPQKNNGCPTWHPSGDYIVFTAEKRENLEEHKEWAIPGTGLNCDLWMMTSDGQNFYQLTDYPIAQPWIGIIHPQFSHDGKKLFWAERIEQGESLGGGWVLKIADFVIEGQQPHLENISICEPGEQSCFYESHAFSKDNKNILFSGNLKSGQSVSELDIYELNLETNQLKRLTEVPNEWDEHAEYSPDGKKIAGMSSAGFDIDWGDTLGHNWHQYLITELWLMNADGSNRQQLTYFNDPNHSEYMNGKRCVVSDSIWSPDGKKIVALVAYESFLGMKAKIVMIEFE